MDKINLVKILEGNISLIDHVNVNDEALPEDHVTIEPCHVRKMLKDYLAGRINSKELTRWAMFICLRAEYYGTPYSQDEEMADYFEDMFYVIQRLSTPEIDGEVNEENVTRYLAELDKYSAV